MNVTLRDEVEPRGPEARKILETEFGRKYSLPAVCALMHRLGLSPLRPGMRHRKNDPVSGHHTSNRVCGDYDHLFESATRVCRDPGEERLQSVCRTDWIEHAE